MSGSLWSVVVKTLDMLSLKSSGMFPRCKLKGFSLRGCYNKSMLRRETIAATVLRVMYHCTDNPRVRQSDGHVRSIDRPRVRVRVRVTIRVGLGLVYRTLGLSNPRINEPSDCQPVTVLGAVNVNLCCRLQQLSLHHWTLMRWTDF